MQKSKVQEMFPINENKLWRVKFWEWCTIPIIIVMVTLPLGIIAIVESPFNPKLFAGALLSWVAAVLFLIVGYFYANRSVRNYFFDVTDNAVILGSKKILFKDILDVYVFQERRGGGYGLRSTIYYVQSKKSNATLQEGSVMVYIPDLGPFNTHAIFDKNTAFALKNYIIEKMRK